MPIPTIGKRLLFHLTESYGHDSPCGRPISNYDNSPKNKAFDHILQGGLSSQVIEVLSCLTEGSDFIEEQNYTRMHKIVLGLSLKSLEEELILHPEQIDSRDALGRTPLIWAAARGNDHNVVLLLGAGADPNSIDIQFTTAVSYAAERDHAVCVRLLLEAGADPDPPLPRNIKVGSGLNCAARNATNPLVMKLLLDFGADLESSGVENFTSLIHAARTDNASFAVLLLEYGADINATTTLGHTPLTTAITHNSHRVLQLLLDRWSEYSECPRLKGTHLLQIAALYADIETIEILKGCDHLALSHDSSFIAADFATRLRERWDFSEKLIIAFEDLLYIIDRKPDSRVGTPSLMESGLLLCPYSDSEKAWSDAESENGSSDQSFDEAVEVL